MRATYLGIDVIVSPLGFEIIATGLKFGTLEELDRYIKKERGLWKI